MSITAWIGDLVRGGSIGYAWKYDSEGINFVLKHEQSEKIRSGQANDLLIHQFVALRMLVEQGEAEELPNGVMIPSEIAVHLNEDIRLLFDLPETWKGELQADIKGTTGSVSFQINLKAADDGGSPTYGFSVEGPIISFSPEKHYLLSPPHLLIFSALERHQKSSKTEYDDLSLIFALQQAQEKGASISLGHFRRLKIRAPESITVEAELDEVGCLILTPQMGQAASHERIQRVLGQLSTEAAASLRVDDEIILFDEPRLAAVREILRNRVIAKHKINAFLKNPTAFIDASLVDLDLGFSARVKGATRFRHAYFGETDEPGIDWFGKKFAPAEILPPKKLGEVIIDNDQLKIFREELEKARKTGAQEMEFCGKVFDVSDAEIVDSVLVQIEAGFSKIELGGA